MIEELTAEQRWLWIGLLLLAGDSSIPGIIFRRKGADGSPTGFSSITLAETLDINLSAFDDGIKRMVEKGKISIDGKGVISILNWNKYQSEYQRQRPYRDGYKKSCNQGNALDRDIERDIDVEKNNGRSGPLSEDQIDKKFQEFWSAYPKEGRLARKESLVKFGEIVKRGALTEFVQGFHGYLDYLKHQRTDNGFDQRPMYAKTFLNGRWEEFVGFKYEAQL